MRHGKHPQNEPGYIILTTFYIKKKKGGILGWLLQLVMGSIHTCVRFLWGFAPESNADYKPSLKCYIPLLWFYCRFGLTKVQKNFPAKHLLCGGNLKIEIRLYREKRKGLLKLRTTRLKEKKETITEDTKPNPSLIASSNTLLGCSKEVGLH